MSKPPNVEVRGDDPEYRQARFRCMHAIRQLAMMGAMSVQPDDLRYVIELQQVELDLIWSLLDRAGDIVPGDIFDRRLTLTRARADELERRIQQIRDYQQRPVIDD